MAGVTPRNIDPNLNPNLRSQIKSTYTYFDNWQDQIHSDDIVLGSRQEITEGAFTSLGSSGDGTLNGFYTSSTQSALSSSHYYLNIYDQVSSAVTATVQFDITYGNRNGFYNSSTYDNDYDPAKQTYYQYRNLILPNADGSFSYANANTGSADFFAINFKRNRMKEEIDPDNWELTLTGDVGTIHLIDNSSLSSPTTPLVNFGVGKAYYVCSGSIAGGIVGTVTANEYGLFYPDLGIIMLNPYAISSSIGWTYSSSLNDTSDAIASFYDVMHTGNHFSARSMEEVKSTHYFVRLKNKKYNFSNNPSWATGSSGLIKHEDMWNDPKIYVTTIGLYDDNNNLLAVAKLNKPQLKSFERELLIKVKVDY